MDDSSESEKNTKKSSQTKDKPENNPQPVLPLIKINRNGQPITSVHFDQNKMLSSLREELRHTKNPPTNTACMQEKDVFLDGQHPVDMAHEKQPVKSIINDARTVSIQGEELKKAPVKAGPNTVRIERNGSSLVSLKVQADETLANLRIELSEKGYMVSNDRFLDQGKYPVDPPHEDRMVIDLENKEGAIGISRQGTAIERLRPAKPPEDIVKGLMDKMSKENKLDLSPTKIEDLRKELEHGLIKALPVNFSGVQLSDPLNLNVEHWTHLIKKNQMLSGLQIKEGAPRRAFKVAFSLPSGVPRFLCWDVSSVTSSMTYSKQVHSWVRSKIDKNEASVSYLFVSASVEMNHTEKTSREDEEQTSYATGEWNFPRVIVNFEPGDLPPTEAFLMALEKALNEPEVDSKDPGERLRPKYFELSKVFEEFGHIMPSEITLGGQLQIVDSQSSNATKAEKYTEDTMKIAVAAKVGALAGSVGHTSSTADDSKSSAVKELQKKNFVTTGGNTLAGQSPEIWVPTVGPYQAWSTINMSGLRPLYELLKAPEDATDKAQKKLNIRINKTRQSIEKVIQACKPVATTTVLGLDKGDVISISFDYSFEKFHKGDYDDGEKSILEKIPPHLTLSTAGLNLGYNVALFQQKADGFSAFTVEFPLGKEKGNFIALRSNNPTLKQEQQMYLGIRMEPRLPQINGKPFFLLTAISTDCNPYNIFRVKVVDEKNGLVSLSPYMPKTAEGVLIPQNLNIVTTPPQLDTIKIRSLLWSITANTAATDPFGIFKITKEAAKT